MHDLKKILQSQSREEMRGYFPVPRETVRNWMESTDMASLSLAYELITDDYFMRGVVPPLEFEEIYSFSLQFLERCVREDPQPDDEDLDTFTRYRAGREIYRWFHVLWDNTIHHDKLDEFKRWLERIVREGDDEIRNCVYCSMMEHLDKRAGKFFKDWRKDPVLKTAME